MHTTNLSEGWYAIHNGNFSGEVKLGRRDWHDDAMQPVPFEVLIELVAESKRREKIAQIENATPRDVLGME